MLLPESKAADTVAVAGGDFNETVAQFTVDDALERLNAVIQTVEEQIIAPESSDMECRTPFVIV